MLVAIHTVSIFKGIGPIASVEVISLGFKLRYSLVVENLTL